MCGNTHTITKYFDDVSNKLFILGTSGGSTAQPQWGLTTAPPSPARTAAGSRKSSRFRSTIPRTPTSSRTSGSGRRKRQLPRRERVRGAPLHGNRLQRYRQRADHRPDERRAARRHGAHVGPARLHVARPPDRPLRCDQLERQVRLHQRRAWWWHGRRVLVLRRHEQAADPHPRSRHRQRGRASGPSRVRSRRPRRRTARRTRSASSRRSTAISSPGRVTWPA